MLEQFHKFPVLLHPGDCTDKVCIVTGSNIGIGLETAKHLVRCSAARVILAVRNTKGGEQAKKEIEAETQRTGVIDVWHLDLASFASVKTFAQKASKKLDRIDFLVENAAVYLDQWTLSEGIETTVTVNVTSTMLLAAMLMPKLVETGRKHGSQPRLVFVGSMLGFTAKSELDKCSSGSSIYEGMNDPKRANMDQRYEAPLILRLRYDRHLTPSFISDMPLASSSRRLPTASLPKTSQSKSPESRSTW
jgi:hypothetical protein